MRSPAVLYSPLSSEQQGSRSWCCCWSKCLMNCLTRPLTVIFILSLYLFLALLVCHVIEKSGGWPYSLHARHPTLYQYYRAQGIQEGLRAPRSGFTLNGLPIIIYSGSVHYFRIHPDYWRDRLRKARAAGLNAVDTYVPWNLHEPRMGEFDFGDGDNDLSMMLDVRRFVQMAQEEDLFVIFRPGPYICAEWEFGGLPSWLLRYKGIKIRTSDPTFTNHVQLYFDQLLPRIANLTFSHGGPIIALQIENEYGSFGLKKQSRDKAYLQFIRDQFLRHGLYELHFTSDSPASTGSLGALPGVLQTANLAGRAELHFRILQQLQPNNAFMVMELWSGWFDHWLQDHHETGNPPFVFSAVLTSIFSFNASVNFYMFAGGSSFAFMSGANVKPQFPIYEPDVSSYDYGAPISEAGDYTEKYRIAKALIASNNPIQTHIPDMPPQSVKTAYGGLDVAEYIPIRDVLDQVPDEDRVKVHTIGINSSMENLPINNGNGQSYGITVYRKIFRATSSTAKLHITGHVRDIAIVLINGELRTDPPTGQDSLKKFGFWPARNAELLLKDLQAGIDYQLDILVENTGRVNFGLPFVFNQWKGLWEGPVFLNDVELTDWDVLALQLKGSWVHKLTGWRPVIPNEDGQEGPAMFRTRFIIQDPPTDTYLQMGEWTKGCIFVNGFPLGRYFYLGPQLTNFLPAPLLKKGENDIIVFEHYLSAKQLKFTNIPDLGTPRKMPGNVAFFL